jgi:hypothetical protein
MEQTTDVQIPTHKIYKDRAIWLGAFFGGPLAAGYIIAENFKAFNQPDKAKKTWIYTIIATIIIFGIIFLIPDSVKIPNHIIPLIHTGIAYYLMQHFQSANITAHINAGGLFYRWWRVVFIGLVGLVVIFISFFSILFLTGKLAVNETTKTYGFMKHEITFDNSNISENEVNKIADGFIKTTFFDEAVTKYVYVEKVNNSFEISLSCDKSVTSNAEALQFFDQLRTELQTLFPDNKIVFNLVVDNLDNIVKRLE